MAPFRAAVAGEVITSPTERGTLALEVGPHHVTLTLGTTHLAVADGALTISSSSRRRRRLRRPIGNRLVVARGRPSEGVGLWHEVAPDEVERVFGAEPRDLIAHDGLLALRQLDRLTRRLSSALVRYGHGVRSAVEVGPAADRGLDKVLVADFGDHLSLYRRSLFRHRARRVLDVHEDGTVVVYTPAGKYTVECRSRFACTVIGDYVRFATVAGDARVSLPWITREDREELVRRIGEVVERGRSPAALPAAVGY